MPKLVEVDKQWWWCDNWAGHSIQITVAELYLKYMLFAWMKVGFKGSLREVTEGRENGFACQKAQFIYDNADW